MYCYFTKNKRILRFFSEYFKFYFHIFAITRSIISAEIQKERFEEVDR